MNIETLETVAETVQAEQTVEIFELAFDDLDLVGGGHNIVGSYS